MGDWAVALIGVGGTLAGTAVGGLLGYVADRTRWNRERDARWVDARLALYSKVIVECQYVVNEVTFGKPLDGRTYGELLRDLRPVNERLRPLLADLELIGTKQDAEAASELFESAQSFMNYALRNPDAPALPALEEWTAALATFRARARAGLHL